MLKPPRRANTKPDARNVRLFVLVNGERIVGTFNSEESARRYIWRESLLGHWRVSEIEKQAYAPLPPGVLVDPLDLPILSAYRWGIGTNGYVIRNVECKACGVRTNEYMHRRIMAAPDILVVDHINRDRLDNRRDNLRVVTIAVNNQNRGPKYSGGIRGVDYMPRLKKYRARASHQHLGLFDTEEEARAAASAWRRNNMPGAVEEVL